MVVVELEDGRRLYVEADSPAVALAEPQADERGENGGLRPPAEG